MSWNDVALLSPGSEGGSHPLDRQGRPAYFAVQRLPSTYQVADQYEEEDGSVRPAIDLFSKKNRWGGDALRDRLFAVWSSEALHRRHGEILFRTLLRHLHAAGPDLDAAQAADLYTETQIYFLEKTGREQRDYLPLVQRHGSYCHYPLETSYRDGDELLRGVLNLYHMRLRDAVRDAARRKSGAPGRPDSLDALQDVPGSEPRSLDAGFSLAETSSAFAERLQALAGLEKVAARRSFLKYLASEGTFAERAALATPLRPHTLRRLEYQVVHRVLPEIAGRGDLSDLGEGDLEGLPPLARHLAGHLLERMKGRA